MTQPNYNDAMTSVHIGVRALDEALTRFEAGDESGRGDARKAITAILGALHPLSNRLAMPWLDTGSGPGYAATDNNTDSPYDPRD